MGDVVKLKTKGPPLYLPQFDARDDLRAGGLDVADRTPTEESIYQDWLSKGKPVDYLPS